MNIVAQTTVEALRDRNKHSFSNYNSALIAACKKSPPPFGQKYYGDIYRDAATDPYWLATSLIENSAREGDGAGRLWDLAACTVEPELVRQIKQHALDESSHSKAYIAMLDIAFPDSTDAELHAHLQRLSPGYTLQSVLKPTHGSPYAHEVTLDDLIQMNIAEIRTRIHHLLQRPMLLGHCPPDRRARLTRILDSLLFDETTHIEYTAALIEGFALNGDTAAVNSLMQERLNDFNEITREELGQGIFESV